MQTQTTNKETTAMHTSLITIIANIIIAMPKLIVGIAIRSNALISDGIHSVSDIFSTFVVMIGVKLGNKEADTDHPYGHERLECVAAIILSGILFATGIKIGIDALASILYNDYSYISTPTIWAYGSALFSIAGKEAMYWYTRNAARKINSGALLADAWHHRSDAFSSVGSLAGLIGVKMGYPMLDSIAGIIICVFIVKAAIDIFIDAVNKMTDKSCDQQFNTEIREFIIGYDGILGIDTLKTRIFGDRIYIDVEVQIDGERNLREAHEIAEKLHDLLEETYPLVKHCMIHVNPV